MHVNRRVRAGYTFVLFFYAASLVPQCAVAARVQSIAYSVVPATANEAANHSILFQTKSEISSGTIRLFLSNLVSGTGSVAASDIDLSYGSTAATASQNELALAVDSGNAIWGVSVDSSAKTLTFTYPSLGVATIPASSYINIRIGTNAYSGSAGTRQMVNAASAGSKSISLVAGTDIHLVSVDLSAAATMAVGATVDAVAVPDTPPAVSIPPAPTPSPKTGENAAPSSESSAPSPASGQDARKEEQKAAPPPSAPKQLMAEYRASDKGVVLTWSNDLQNGESLLIERKISGGQFGRIEDVSLSALTATDTTIQLRTQYVYRLKVSNAAGAYNYSKEVTVTTPTPPLPPPAAPAELTGSAAGGIILLAWKDNSSNETGFELQRRLASEPIFTFKKTITESIYGDVDVLPRTRYVYRVRALSRSGFSPFSAELSIVSGVRAEKPNAPVLTGLYDTQTHMVKLSWTVAGDVPVSFQLLRKTSSENIFSLVKDVPSQATDTEFTNFQTTDAVERDREYRYIIRVGNESGITDSNELAVATPSPLSPPPSLPTDLSLVSDTYQRVLLQWVDTSSNETGFQVQRAPSFSPEVSANGVISLAANGTTFRDFTVDADRAYQYRVRAINSAVTSPVDRWSEWVEVKTPPAPPPPPALPSAVANLSAEGEVEEVFLSWRDVANEKEYALERRAEKDSVYTPLVLLPAQSSSYVDSTVVPGTSYTYRIFAVNETGSSPETVSLSTAALPAEFSRKTSQVTFAPPAAEAEITTSNGGTVQTATKTGSGVSVDIPKNVRPLVEGVSGVASDDHTPVSLSLSLPDAAELIESTLSGASLERVSMDDKRALLSKLYAAAESVESRKPEEKTKTDTIFTSTAETGLRTLTAVGDIVRAAQSRNEMRTISRLADSLSDTVQKLERQGARTNKSDIQEIAFDIKTQTEDILARLALKDTEREAITALLKNLEETAARGDSIDAHTHKVRGDIVSLIESHGGKEQIEGKEQSTVSEDDMEQVRQRAIDIKRTSAELISSVDALLTNNEEGDDVSDRVSVRNKMLQAKDYLMARANKFTEILADPSAVLGVTELQRIVADAHDAFATLSDIRSEYRETQPSRVETVSAVPSRASLVPGLSAEQVTAQLQSLISAVASAVPSLKKYSISSAGQSGHGSGTVESRVVGSYLQIASSAMPLQFSITPLPPTESIIEKTFGSAALVEKSPEEYKQAGGVGPLYVISANVTNPNAEGPQSRIKPPISKPLSLVERVKRALKGLVYASSHPAHAENTPPPSTVDDPSYPAYQSVLPITKFDPSLSYVFTYTPEDSMNVSEGSIRLYSWDDVHDIWRKEESTLDREKRTVTASVSHLSIFRLFGESFGIPPSEKKNIIVVPQAAIHVIESEITNASLGLTDETAQKALSIAKTKFYTTPNTALSLCIPGTIFKKAVKKIILSVGIEKYTLHYQKLRDCYATRVTMPDKKGRQDVVLKVIYTDDQTQTVKLETEITSEFEAQLLTTVIPTLQQAQVVATIANTAVQKTVETTQGPLQTAAALTAPVVTMANPAILSQTMNFFTYLSHLATWLLSFLGLRRKRTSWGVVYDAITKLPVDLAVVRLFDSVSQKLIETQVTDKLGRFSFIALPGTYALTVTKLPYLFPSKLTSGSRDGEYANLYHGEPVPITRADAQILMSIPLDPPVVHHVNLHQQPLSLAKTLVANTARGMLVFGFFVSILLALYTPSVVNTVLLVMNWLFASYQVFLMVKKERPWGTVFDVLTLSPVPLAAISIFDAKEKKLLRTRLSDYEGRFTFLTPPGDYILTANKDAYTFPATHVPNDRRHPHPYLGGELHVKKQNDTVRVNIPIEPKNTGV